MASGWPRRHLARHDPRSLPFTVANEEGRGIWWLTDAQIGVAYSTGAPWTNYLPVVRADIADDRAALAWCEALTDALNLNLRSRSHKSFGGCLKTSKPSLKSKTGNLQSPRPISVQPSQSDAFNTKSTSPQIYVLDQSLGTKLSDRRRTRSERKPKMPKQTLNPKP